MKKLLVLLIVISIPGLLLAEETTLESSRSLLLELADDNTVMVQKVDPKTDLLEITLQEGNTFQILTFVDQSEVTEKGCGQCGHQAATACGTGNVLSYSCESSRFWNTCSFSCSPLSRKCCADCPASGGQSCPEAPQEPTPGSQGGSQSGDGQAPGGGDGPEAPASPQQ